MSELEELRTALRLFIGAAYPVDISINPRGHNWSEAYLDQAFAAALDALARSGQAASGSSQGARSDVQNGVGQPEAPTAAPLSMAMVDVVAERRRQVETEGWTQEHDDEHSDDEMACAAACYALPEALRVVGASTFRVRLPTFWPWAKKWWKPGDRRRELVKAGALILAEIERLDRAHPPARSGAGSEEGQG